MKKTPKFGAFLKSEREKLSKKLKRKVTQQVLVELMGGRGVTNYALYETGQRHPSDMSMWKDIEKVFGWNAEQSNKYWDKMLDEAFTRK